MKLCAGVVGVGRPAGAARARSRPSAADPDPHRDAWKASCPASAWRSSACRLAAGTASSSSSPPATRRRSCRSASTTSTRLTAPRCLSWCRASATRLRRRRTARTAWPSSKASKTCSCSWRRSLRWSAPRCARTSPVCRKADWWRRCSPSDRRTLFSSALAACAPIGSFRQQVNYLGDFRVLFDYYFPGVLPGSAGGDAAGRGRLLALPPSTCRRSRTRCAGESRQGARADAGGACGLRSGRLRAP